MKLLLVSFFSFFISFNGFGQAPAELTPEAKDKIKREIAKEVSVYKQALEKEKLDPAIVEFKLDTFRIERYMSRCIDLDFSDYGMRAAGTEAAHLYDSLLNKYYRKLNSVLKEQDRKVLVQAQKAWLTFRDNEMKLTETISKDEYSGGGTMQMLTESAEYLDLLTKRTVAIFEHYLRAAQIY